MKIEGRKLTQTTLTRRNIITVLPQLSCFNDRGEPLIVKSN